MLAKCPRKRSPSSTDRPTRKRTHLNPSQIAVLQESYVANPLPDATFRSQLARELNVSERTVQIWFQNRRAKARKVNAQGAGLGGYNGSLPQLMPNVRTGWVDISQVPQPRPQATFRSTMTPEHFRKPEQSPPSDTSNQQKPNDQVYTVPLPIHALRIGTWARFAQYLMPQEDPQTAQYDLSCYCTPREMVWEIKDGGHRFRFQVDLAQIRQMSLVQHEFVDELHVNHEGVPQFFMWRAGIDQGWIRCGDFSEDGQASLQNIYTLQADSETLQQALLTVFGRSPDLISKFVASPPVLDYRESTMSPSATPEPLILDNNFLMADTAKACPDVLLSRDWSNPWIHMFQPQTSFL